MNISVSEIAVILLIALLVIKPEQMPDVAFTLGKFFKSMRRMLTNIKQEVGSALDSVDKPDERKQS
jgi:Sec-independent protein translocase protein TatA